MAYPSCRVIKEIFMESLLHRKIFKKNPVLGYMHMSLAFGWFLLIVFGTIEADFFGEKHLNPPSHAIFFRAFNPDHGAAGLARVYTHWMDLLLAFILSGLLLAMIKRFIPGMMGMKKTTKHTWTDRIALLSLWLIFPSRLMAESFTCGAYGSGGFLTGNLGSSAGVIPSGSGYCSLLLVALFTCPGNILHSAPCLKILPYTHRTVAYLHAKLRHHYGRQVIIIHRGADACLFIVRGMHQRLPDEFCRRNK
ncbi:MAG: hypothetical protein MZV63_21045 [Marinilabiliales bacterium]|nr:hypothetical protein [Marinilabiliales bacterium]